MPQISLTFGDGGVSVEREFDVAPRIGDIVHITYGGEDIHLVIDLVQHAEDADDSRMRCLLHGRIVEDVTREIGGQIARQRLT